MVRRRIGALSRGFLEINRLALRFLLALRSSFGERAGKGKEIESHDVGNISIIHVSRLNWGAGWCVCLYVYAPIIDSELSPRAHHSGKPLI